MGVVSSVYLTDTEAKVILMKRGRRGFVFERSLRVLPGEHGFPSLYLSYFYPDLISESLRIPPVRDEETRDLLVKKRLSEMLPPQGNLLLVVEELPESSPKEKVLRAFAIPEEVYRRAVPKDLEEKLTFFTVPDLSLHGVSTWVAQDRNVLHAYGDEESLVMTASGGGEVLYTRSLKVPAYAKDDDLSYSDFVLESLNMTYMFLVQRSRIPVHLLLLSGKLPQKERLVEGLLNFVSCGVAVPLPPELLRNVSPELFLENLPCFGNLLLQESFDFSPKEVKERRRIRLYLSKLIPLLTLLLLLLTLLLGLRVHRIGEELREISRLKGEVAKSLSSTLGHPFLKEGSLDYFLNYLNLLASSKRENPLNALPELRELLLEFQWVEYSVSYQEGKVVVSLSLERSFGSLSELSLQRQRLIERLEEAKKRGFSYRIESESKDLEGNRLSMKVSLEKAL